MPEQVKEALTSLGGPSQYGRANHLSDLGTGAKDSSSHPVAGLHRSFPQDSWRLDGVNQLLGGSMSLSPLYPNPTNDLHVNTATVLQDWLKPLRPVQA